MKKKEILTIIHDERLEQDGGIVGSLVSLNNIIRKIVIYKGIYVESTSHSHVFSDPIYYIINNKDNILKMMDKIDFDALELMNEKCEMYSNYYEIITITGNRITIPAFKLDKITKENLDNLIENNEYVGKTSEKYLDYPPILNYTNTIIEEKINSLEQIVLYVEQKNKKNFYKMLDDNCTYTYENKKLMNKKEIKKHINSITGYLNFNNPYSNGAYYCGYINKDNQSDILIEVSYYSRPLKTRINKYFVFEFNNNKIVNILVFNKDSIVAKQLNGTALYFVKNRTYNEIDSEMVTKIKKDNKTYQEMLNDLFPPTGTRTKMNSIRK